MAGPGRRRLGAARHRGSVTAAMSRRIDIELTSRADDGSWTWRAAGARQPKGVLDAALVPPGATAGALFRAEVESGLDGLEVVSVAPPKTASSESRGDRIEIIAAPPRGPDVSVTLAPGSRRRRDGEDRPPRRDGAGRGGPGGPRARDGGRRPAAGPRPDGDAPAGERRPPARRSAGPGDGERREPRRDRPEGPDDSRRGPAPVRRERKSTVSTVHRNAVLASLRPEQLPVAEQLLRGGIPAVRQAISEQNAAARADGTAGHRRRALLAMAEELLPPDQPGRLEGPGHRGAGGRAGHPAARAAGRRGRLGPHGQPRRGGPGAGQGPAGVPRRTG